MRLILMAAAVAVASPTAAQIPADVSMGVTVSGDGCCAVAGEVTEHLGDRLALVGGAFWAVQESHSGFRRRMVRTAGFYGGPRLYTEPPGRFRAFGELAFGYFNARPPTHAITLTPAWGVEVRIGQRTRIRTSAGFGVAIGPAINGPGFNVTTALVLIPTQEEE